MRSSTTDIERERIHLLLIEDVKRGVADIADGRTVEADGAIALLQQRRAAATESSDSTVSTTVRG